MTSPCPDCRGEGRRLDDRTLTVDIPAGVDDGATLRIAGAGAAALRGGASGDLYVHLRVEADSRFERSGTDLLTTLHVSVTQAALGTEVELDTLDGPYLLSVPAGVQTGRVLKIAGHGVPRLRGGRRGDLLVSIFVDTPSSCRKRRTSSCASSRPSAVSRSNRRTRACSPGSAPLSAERGRLRARRGAPRRRGAGLRRGSRLPRPERGRRSPPRRRPALEAR